MLEQIEIKKVASYDDAGIQIIGLKKVIFIYGVIGSGKTTISNFLFSPSEDKFSSCLANWKNGQEIKALVYNKELRDRNFGKGKLGGIFTLGEATADEIAILEAKNEQLKGLKVEGVTKRETLNVQKVRLEVVENEFKEKAWSGVYKKYEKNFNEAFDKVKCKERFKDKLITEFSSNTAVLQTVDELKTKATPIFDDAPISLNVFSNDL